MAGINFLLEKYVQRNTLSGAILREALNVMEAVGPWFLTVLYLGIIGITVYVVHGTSPVRFYLLITYATALSLILSSPVHSMFTRSLADDIFLMRYQAITDGLITLCIIMIVISGGVASLIVFPLSSVPFDLKISFVGMTTLLSLLWCVSTTLSTLRKEKIFFMIFSLGIAASLLVFLVLRPADTKVLMVVFSLAPVIPVALGGAYIVKVYLREAISVDLRFFRRPGLVKLGLAIFSFSVGFWIDKFIFWYLLGKKESIDTLFRYYTEYDIPFFVALVIMMIGSFLVYRGIKDKITGPYESFVFKISNNFPFSELALEKYNLVRGISYVSSTIVVFYGGIVIFILFLIYIDVVPIPWRNPFVFHYLLLGTIFFSLYFFCFLVLQYLDDYAALLVLNLIFLSVNAGGTVLSIHLGYEFHGTGFMAACIVSALVGFVMINAKMGGLEYEVFRKAVRQSEG